MNNSIDTATVKDQSKGLIFRTETDKNLWKKETTKVQSKSNTAQN